MSTVEVEDTIELAKQFDHMVVGVINTIEQHPNADKLRVCMTDIGGRVESIVCGGSNLREGHEGGRGAARRRVPLARRGRARGDQKRASSGAWTATA